MKLNKKSKKGFTIVELVVVIAVIGILSAILIPTFMGLSDNARKQAVQSDLSSIYTQYAVEAADGVIDDEEGYNIDILGQEQVVIEYKEDAQYTFSRTENKWVSADITVAANANLHSLVYTTGGYINHNDTKYPTFAGYKVYKLAENPQPTVQP